MNDVGDSDADDGNAVDVKDSGTYVGVVTVTCSSRIVC